MKPSLDDKVALVTGARSIGKRTAIQLAELGADVTLVTPDRGRAAVLKEEIKRESGSTKVTVIAADTVSQREVHRAAREFRDRHDRLHLLIHTASEVFPERQLTVDGVERTFAVNYLSPFLLTTLLVEPLTSAAPARVLSVASRVHRNAELDLDDEAGPEGYTPARAFARSQLATILFTYELAGRLDGTGVTVNCVEPSLAEPYVARRTAGLPRTLGPFARLVQRSAKRRAHSLVRIAADPQLEGVSAEYFSASGVEKRTSADSYDPRLAAELWDHSITAIQVPAL